MRLSGGLVGTVAVLAGAALVAAAYGAGVSAWRRRAPRTLGAGSVAAALAGVLTVAVAVLPPVDERAEALFSLHMAQHLALGLVAPMLLVAGRVGDGLAWAVAPATRRQLRAMLPRWARRRRAPGAALVGAGVTVAVWSFWHVPPAYDLALAHPAAHAAEHVTLLGSGLLLWSAVALRRRRAAPAVLALFLVTLGLGALAATLAMAPTALYDGHRTGQAAWGVDPLTDQQLGAMLMWTPGGLVYLLAGIAQLVRWLGLERTRPDLVRTAP